MKGNLIFLLLLALAGCSAVPTASDWEYNSPSNDKPKAIEKQRLFGIGASYQNLDVDDGNELGGAQGSIRASQVFDGGWEIGGNIGVGRWEFGDNDAATMIRSELDFSYNYALTDTVWIYGGPHAGWAHFNEQETDDSFSYGAHVGVRAWVDESVFMFVEPRWSRYELFDQGVNDVQAVLGIGMRF